MTMRAFYLADGGAGSSKHIY